MASTRCESSFATVSINTGWNVAYDFNESDFVISRKLVSLYLTKSYEDNDEFLPWGSLKYLIGDAMYGGRVSDNMDRRVLVTYLDEYMGDFLFDDCQKFFFSRVGFDYTTPEWGPLENYTAMIETLPRNNAFTEQLSLGAADMAEVVAELVGEAGGGCRMGWGEAGISSFRAAQHERCGCSRRAEAGGEAGVLAAGHQAELLH